MLSFVATAMPVALAFGTAVVHAGPSQFIHPAGPNAAARAAGKLYFGTATNTDELNDTRYFAILDDIRMFGQLTAAKAMKWVRARLCLWLCLCLCRHSFG